MRLFLVLIIIFLSSCESFFFQEYKIKAYKFEKKKEIDNKNQELLREHKFLKEKIKSLQLEVKNKLDLEDGFNQEIEELSQ